MTDVTALGIGRLVTWLLDFALPPRCAGCGTIVSVVHSFCADCWTHIEFLGSGGCVTCGMPLQATDAELCALCLARPPRIDRTRAAVAYDDVSRGLALRLKYGRKVAVAKTMARFMAPLIEIRGADVLLVTVPLHRRRPWQRGFNQSAIVARELSRQTGLANNVTALKRIKATPPLKGLSVQQRRRAVAGVFKVGDRTAFAGRTIVLVDDVLTTGSTANACARELRRAGATRIELISWARVVRPARLER
ncbi:MAG: ComF family protein [Sphingomicrobium sp.]